MQGGARLADIGQHPPQTLAQGIGGERADPFKGFVLAQALLAGQFRRQQKQQLTQLHGQTSLEQARFAATDPVKGQQDFLLQHVLPGVLTTGALNQSRNPIA